MCVKKRDYPLSRQVEAKQDEGKENSGRGEENDNSLVVEQSAEAAK